MTPYVRQTLTEAVALIRAASNAETFDAPAVRAALIAKGAVFIDGATNLMKLCGVTAALDFDNGEQLLVRWAANARSALETAELVQGRAGEEE